MKMKKLERVLKPLINTRTPIEFEMGKVIALGIVMIIGACF